MLLQLLGENILTVGKNNKILFSSGNIYKSFVINISKVTGSEPTVLCYNLSGSLGVVEIPHHNVVTLNHYLAGSLALGSVDLNLASGNGGSD
jgi:hypothetical protein